MNIEIRRNQQYFELLPTGPNEGRRGHVIKRRRVLVGRSQACDIVIPHDTVTAIHAVIEVSSDRFRIYDMNSRNGTLVNGKKVVAQDIKIGDEVTLGSQAFIFKNYEKEEVPPPLEMLDPRLPPPIKEEKREKILPKKSPEIIAEVPRVAYPLAQDPKAEFSEYIFEDVEILYPIFDYSSPKAAIEIIILFKDKIYSIDYLPQKDGVYHLIGSNPKKQDIEYAYLGKDEKLPFIEISGMDIFVQPLPGYDCLSLTDEVKKIEASSGISMRGDDILRFSQGDLQIFVRGTEAPPKVAHAPLLRRDKELKKYLILMFLFVLLFMSGMTLFNVDEEIEKEKQPERVATILYKKKLTVSKSPAIDKTENQPKKIIQKSPLQTQPEKKTIAEKEIPRPQKKEANQAKAGVKDATKAGEVKKVTPNKGPQDNLKTKVVRPTQTTQKGPTAKAKTAPQRTAPSAKSKGHVDTYKSFDFKSTISSIVSKGGTTKSVKAATATATSDGPTGLTPGGESATLKRAQVSGQVGSLSGSAKGTLDSSKGVEGLVDKKSIYTAGLPYKTVILGGMDPDVIRKILIDHLPQFRYCYQKVLDRAEASFHGKVRLDFIIGASGHVTKASVITASDAIPGNVRACVVNVLRGIKFPEPLGGGVVEVNQPFNFYPVRQ